MSLLPGSKWDAPYNRGTGAYAAAAMPQMQQQQPQLGMRGAQQTPYGAAAMTAWRKYSRLGGQAPAASMPQAAGQMQPSAAGMKPWQLERLRRGNTSNLPMYGGMGSGQNTTSGPFMAYQVTGQYQGPMKTTLY